MKDIMENKLFTKDTKGYFLFKKYIIEYALFNERRNVKYRFSREHNEKSLFMKDIV